MSTTETYNGWKNRETWALMLHINNDQGLSETAHEIVTRSFTYNFQRDAAFREWVESLLTRSGYVEEYGDTWPDALADMAEDVGSLYRIDWTECVDNLLSDLELGTCDSCGDTYPLAEAGPDLRCGDCGDCSPCCEHDYDETKEG